MATPSLLERIQSEKSELDAAAAVDWTALHVSGRESADALLAQLELWLSGHVGAGLTLAREELELRDKGRDEHPYTMERLVGTLPKGAVFTVTPLPFPSAQAKAVFEVRAGTSSALVVATGTGGWVVRDAIARLGRSPEYELTPEAFVQLVEQLL